MKKQKSKQNKNEKKSEKLPGSIRKFNKRYPEIWEAFANLGSLCHDKGGPLDEKTRRLVKLGISIGAQHEGAVHSAARTARAAGVSKEEAMQVAILAVTSIGWPPACAAMTWIEDIHEE